MPMPHGPGASRHAGLRLSPDLNPSSPMLKTCLHWAVALALGVAGATEVYPTVRLKELPDGLKRLWRITQPDMTDQSRCAAAFDDYGDADKMTLQCSVHIRMAAEGARRAMRYCEEKRTELKIKGACKIVVA